MPERDSLRSKTETDLRHHQVVDMSAELAEFRTLIGDRKWTRSKLNKHRAEIVGLHQAGASLREIVKWLVAFKRIETSKDSVARFLKWDAEERSGA